LFCSVLFSPDLSRCGALIFDSAFTRVSHLLKVSTPRTLNTRTILVGSCLVKRSPFDLSSTDKHQKPFRVIPTYRPCSDILRCTTNKKPSIPPGSIYNGRHLPTKEAHCTHPNSNRPTAFTKLPFPVFLSTTSRDWRHVSSNRHLVIHPLSTYRSFLVKSRNPGEHAD
jgi:hypothetical protein